MNRRAHINGLSIEFCILLLCSFSLSMRAQEGAKTQNWLHFPWKNVSYSEYFFKNLITIGTSANLMWENGNLFFYYPAHSPAEAPGEDRLQLSIKDNYGTVTRLRPYNLDGILSIKLSKDLLLVN